MRIEKVIDKAKQVLELDEGQEDLISVFDAYTAALTEWLSENEGAFTPANRSIDRSAVAQLAELHNQVTAKANHLKGQTLENLKNLENRGRAILAYIDQLPERISRHKGKKG